MSVPPTGTVAVFGSSRPRPGDPAYADGVRLGGLLAGVGLEVVTGGYGGVMEAVSAGAAAAGGTVVGVTAPAVFPDREGPNGHITTEIVAATISERIHRLVDLADAVVTLPGSIGTFTELVVAWNVATVAPLSGRVPPTHVAVGPVWREVLAYLAPRVDGDLSLVTCVDTVDEAAAIVAAAVAGGVRP